METTQYTLKSQPEVTIKVPADYAEKAASLVKLAVEDPNGLASKILEHPYLKNPGILSRTRQLTQTKPQTEESRKLQDEVYLKVCIYGNEMEMRGPNRQEAWEIDEPLTQLVRELESRK